MARSYIINGKRWLWRYVSKLQYEGVPCWGKTYYHEKPRYIAIKKGLSQLNELEVSLHEIIHADMPDLSEDSVTRLAATQARILFSCGWRKSDV